MIGPTYAQHVDDVARGTARLVYGATYAVPPPGAG